MNRILIVFFLLVCSHPLLSQLDSWNKLKVGSGSNFYPGKIHPRYKMNVLPKTSPPYTDAYTDELFVCLSPGIIIQKQPFLDLKLFFAETVSVPYSIDAFSGAFIGAESNLKFSNWIYAVKTGYEFSWLFFSARGTLVNYFENGYSDLRIVPEIGISFLSTINLTYGYSIPLLSYESNSIGRNRISVNYVISRRLFHFR